MTAVIPLRMNWRIVVQAIVPSYLVGPGEGNRAALWCLSEQPRTLALAAAGVRRAYIAHRATVRFMDADTMEAREMVKLLGALRSTLNLVAEMMADRFGAALQLSVEASS